MGGINLRVWYSIREDEPPEDAAAKGEPCEMEKLGLRDEEGESPQPQSHMGCFVVTDGHCGIMWNFLRN